MSQKTSPSFAVLLLLMAFAASAKAQETFPQPPELQPDVDFWIDIFTHYTTSDGVLHDNRHLDVVYESIQLPEGASRRERDRRVAQRRDHYRSILKTLAKGKRSNLSEEEARVLALWPDDVSNATLDAAAGRIRFQLGLRDRFEEGLVRAGRWRSFIESELADLGVPIELAALPHVESSYNPDARSHVGASGIWQFTRSTGRRFMRVDHVLDERNDPFVASRSAGQLLAYNYSLTGNWPMAITAYNHGLSGVLRAMRQFGDTAYVDIFHKYDGRTFGFASRNFYVAFLAAMHVDQNADTYFPGLVPDKPMDYAHIDLGAYISAEELSRAFNISPQQLVRYNPSLQPTILQGSKHIPKGTEIRVPASLLGSPIDSLVAAIPDDSWHAEQLPDMFHTIARGDTLSEIASTYKTTVSTLVALNNLSSSNRIRAGQQLRLPAAGPAPAATPAPEPEPVVVASADVPAVETPAVVGEQTPGAMAEEIAPTMLSTIQTALLSDPSDYSVASDNSIEVHPLETLGHYADWLAIRTQRLRDINGLAFGNPVRVGQRIKLDLGTVDAQTFESLRVAYQRDQQDAFFRENVISGVKEHVIRRGESIWVLALREYDVPVWLFRQYNPDVDLHNVRPGTTVRFPVLTDADTS
jgi:membrane-bound lytic murein transglycosylase D